MQRISLQRFLNFIVFFVLIVLLLYNWFSPCNDLDTPRMVPKDPTKVVYDAKNRAYPYDRQMPLIFIGGIPRSGTTLMRAMMDAHPDIRCGEETRVIPRLLGMRSLWAKSEKESRRLKVAGLSNDVIDSALSAFILEVIAKHGEPAPYLCNKDPFTLKSLVYLSQMFPHAKIIFMVRDGRAVVNSIISRNVTIGGFNLKSFRQCLEKWNAGVETMYVQCLRVGPSRCMPVYYEQLVLHPREVTLQVLKFLDIPWHDAVLHHSDFVNMPGGISLSIVERSTDQVIKPINVEALTKWVTSVPTDVRQAIDKIAPMLQRLGYDSHAYPPKYGTADDMVARNTYLIQKNGQYWIRKSDDILKQEKLVSPMAANGIFKYVNKNRPPYSR